MHDRSAHVLPRMGRFLAERLEPALYRATAPVQVSSWEVPGEPVPVATALGQRFEPFALGTVWGRPWGTTWFHVEGSVPSEWSIASDERLELVVDLGFTEGIPGFQSEALVFTPEGTVISALEPLNRSVLLSTAPGRPVDLYLEAASNPDVAQGFTFKETADGDLATATTSRLYTLRTVTLAVLDITAWELLQDFRALGALAHELSADLPRRAEILGAISRALDALDPDDIHGTAALSRAELAEALAKPAYASAHRVHAIGHAHIDSAWLWPLRETRRKVARTFSNVLRLQQQYPDFVFAASSAQQYAWVKEDYPELFERVRQAVAEGRFIPVGGQWIEPDSNLPSGESLSRQFIEGKKFFRDEFGVEPREVWVPDSFGYSGNLPQIARAAGADYFLTQKISWNDTNLFPHHSFLWEGIDGSRIFTHFPPADTYNSMVSAAELHGAQRRFRDKGGSNSSLLPFGWGDGGGGPTREMLASAERYADLEGSPKVILSTPRRFFEEAEAEYENPPVWAGELYLEFHRGVLTTQIEIKRGNRLAESLLRQAEHWSAHAAIVAGHPYPATELERMWRELLLLQFHDILPGTSIHWVHQEAVERFTALHAAADQLIDSAARALLGTGENSAVLNASPYEIDGLEAFAAGRLRALAADHSPAELRLENDAAAVSFDTSGHITSIYDKAAHRELLPSGAVGGLLQLHRDIPTQWDAWDLDESYRGSVTDIAAGTVSPIDGGIRVERSFGGSTIALEYRLRESALDIAVDLDWHEADKMLKLAFPMALHTDRAASEIQYGHLHRTIHSNTSWDAAHFETVAHRWIHVGEPGFGVAFANEATYGYDITRDVVDGESVVTLRASLARAPRYPDPVSDRGRHQYHFSLRTGATLPDAVREGYRLHLPPRTVMGVATTELAPLLRVDNPAVVVEAVKLAEDGSGDLIVRLYEAHGTRARAAIAVGVGYDSVIETDLLERPVEPRSLNSADGLAALTLAPFQLVTLRFAGAGR